MPSLGNGQQERELQHVPPPGPDGGGAEERYQDADTRGVPALCTCALMLRAGLPVLVTLQPGDCVPNLSTEEASEHCSFQDEEDDCTYHYTLKGDPSVLPNATVQVQKKGEQAREVESSILREQCLW